ncbi:hypothetical protein N7528_007068 [Penicillium herquei]|nr:hypothetical protein N7528_007068 [Penicillium herquei]
MPLFASSGDTPMPLEETSSSRWTRFADRLKGSFNGADPRVCIAFWLFGLINNVLYVILLSAALDLVGPDVPKGIVLLADIIPAFTTKLIAPYFIHMVPYSIRVIVFVVLSVVGMVVVALSPSYTEGGMITSKIIGIVLASFSAGGGELSFMGLTHFYGPFSLAAWSSGTGAAGLVGAGAYALATNTMGLSVHVTLFASAALPFLMAVAFFAVLPRDPLRASTPVSDGSRAVEQAEEGERLNAEDNDEEGHDSEREELEGLLGVAVVSADTQKSGRDDADSRLWDKTRKNLKRLGKLFFPFMLPLLVVFIAEYVINQGVAPTLLFPLYTTPFDDFRSFYPAYNAIYQAGVFVSRSSTPFFRIHWLYIPSILQVLNLVLLSLHSMFNFIPNVYIVFLVIFWEGLLGGLVYVNTFAEISDRVPEDEREFSLGATTVSDSAGICIAGFVSMTLEVFLCKFQMNQGREYYHVLGRPSTRFRKIQVFAVVSFWSIYLLRGNKHGPPLLRALSTRFTHKLTAWQTTVVIFLWLYVCRNFAKIVGLECPEPLAHLYSRSFFRATWIATGLDAGFWTAMKIKPKWLRDIASLVFTVYYLIAAEQADEKVRRVRATLTLEHLRVSWNKATTPYLWAMASLMRPRLTRYSPRAIRIPRPKQSVHSDPVSAWLYFDGPLSALKDQTCIILDVPGGGFVAMGPRNSEDKLASWAGQLKVPVLSVDYKKAPEYAYPYALHECYDVYHTIISTRGRCVGFSGQTRPRIVVTGESAGGNLAVSMVLMVLQSTMGHDWRTGEGLPRPEGLVLAYPALNMRVESWMTDEQMSLIQDKSTRQTNRSVLQRKHDEYRKLTPFTSPGHSVENLTALSPPKPVEPNQETNIAAETSKALREKLKRSEELNGNTKSPTDSEVHPLQTRLAVSSMISYVQDRILTPEMMRAMIILYIGPHHRPDFNTDFYLSPVLAPDALLARFPKTYIFTGERDPLVDDTVIFAGRLRQAKLQYFHERLELGLEKSRWQFREKDHVEVSLIPGVSHGFLQMAGFYPEAWKYIKRSGSWIETLFEISELQESQYSLLQMSGSSGLNTSIKGNGHISSKENIPPGSRRNHHRRITGESSGDDDKPLEIGMTKMNTSTDEDLFSKSNLANRRKKSHFTSSHIAAFTTHEDDLETRSETGGEFLARLKHLEMKYKSYEVIGPDEVNSAPESPAALRPRGRSMTSLASEEDLLDRRMNGITGGLMGLSERAQTPGP